MADINPAKHALWTTEMWMTMAMHIPTALTLSGVVGADNKWVLFASLLLSAVTQGSYNVSRSLLKSAMVTANPTPATTEPITTLPPPAPAPTTAPPAKRPKSIAELLLEQGQESIAQGKATQQAIQSLAAAIASINKPKETSDETPPK